MIATEIPALIQDVSRHELCRLRKNSLVTSIKKYVTCTKITLISAFVYVLLPMLPM